MAKAKFEVYEQTDLVGTLDINENDEVVVVVDETMYGLDKILRANTPCTITMKLTKETVDSE